MKGAERDPGPEPWTWESSAQKQEKEQQSTDGLCWHGGSRAGLERARDGHQVGVSVLGVLATTV